MAMNTFILFLGNVTLKQCRSLQQNIKTENFMQHTDPTKIKEIRLSSNLRLKPS